MKTITLKTGELVKVDDGDFELMNRYRWSVLRKKSGLCYAQTTSTRLPGTNGKNVTVRMHRLILGLIDPVIKTDHCDGDGLNNCRLNLRTCTTKFNNRAFRRKKKGCPSQFRGVYWHKTNGYWTAAIRISEMGASKLMHLGVFHSESDAAAAYNQKAIELGFAKEALNNLTAA